MQTELFFEQKPSIKPFRLDQVCSDSQRIMHGDEIVLCYLRNSRNPMDALLAVILDRSTMPEGKRRAIDDALAIINQPPTGHIQPDIDAIAACVAQRGGKLNASIAACVAATTGILPILLDRIAEASAEISASSGQ